MTGAPLTPDELTALAGEYVLGLLAPEERARVEREAELDPALADAIAGWSARLETLADLAPPAEPSELLWRRIARDLPRPARVRAEVGWKWAAAGGYALAAVLAALLLSGRRLDIALRVTPAPVVVASVPQKPPPVPPAPPKMAPHKLETPPSPAPFRPPAPARPDRALALLTAPGESRPALKVHVSGGMARVEALLPVSAAAGRQLDLWVWPHGEKTPILLGAIGGEGGTLPLRVGIDDGTPMMVTSEPAGVPNTGLAGPAVFAGSLTLVD